MGMTLARTNLNEQVYETLRHRLLSRRPGAGAKLSLHELATELGVSRSPVHHALTRLVQEGLLSVKARRGYFVTPITSEAIENGYDVRLALELFAAERTVGRIDAARLAGFRHVLERSVDAISGDDWDTANGRFHEYQVELAGNDLLARHYRDLSVNLMMQVVRGGKVEGGEYLVSEHAAIVEAFEAGELDRAREAIRTHVGSGRRIALEALDRAGGEL
jgi:GntR family transcriptional regulator, rspAB operon transcriptional repressor